MAGAVLARCDFPVKEIKHVAMIAKIGTEKGTQMPQSVAVDGPVKLAWKKAFWKAVCFIYVCGEREKHNQMVSKGKSESMLKG